MYFQRNPIKVILLRMGPDLKKPKYMFVPGNGIEECFVSFSNAIQNLVSQEGNNTEFVIFWIDYARDEIEIHNLMDFCIWTRFLERNALFHPEVYVKPVFQVPSIPPTYFQPIAASTAYLGQPQIMSARAPSFYPTRYPFARVQENTNFPSRCSNRDLRSPLPVVNEVEDAEGLSPEETECLRKLREMGYKDQSGWLIRIIKQVEGNLHKVVAIADETLEETDGSSEL